MDGVVSAVEGYHELSVVLVSILRDHPGLEPEDVLIVGEDFGHVFFRRFGLEAEHTAKRVFWSAIAIERRDFMLDGSFFSLFYFDGN